MSFLPIDWCTVTVYSCAFLPLGSKHVKKYKKLSSYVISFSTSILKNFIAKNVILDFFICRYSKPLCLIIEIFFCFVKIKKINVQADYNNYYGRGTKVQ